MLVVGAVFQLSQVQPTFRNLHLWISQDCPLLAVLPLDSCGCVQCFGERYCWSLIELMESHRLGRLYQLTRVRLVGLVARIVQIAEGNQAGPRRDSLLLVGDF